MNYAYKRSPFLLAASKQYLTRASRCATLFIGGPDMEIYRKKFWLIQNGIHHYTDAFVEQCEDSRRAAQVIGVKKSVIEDWIKLHGYFENENWKVKP